MESDDKLRLTTNRDYLVQNIQADEIVDGLLSEQVLNEDDVERINKMDTNRNKVRKILDTLPKKGPYAYGALKQALRENQEFIVTKLDETDVEEARRKHDAARDQRNNDKNKEKSAAVSGSAVKVSPSVFLDLADNAAVMSNWKDLARRLGLSEGDIVDIKARDRDNLREQTYQSFSVWYERKGEKATIDSLVNGLRKCNLNAAADSLSGN
ncbi:death domain-containing protein CRADD-like [Lineus longissimus]|uniref:death domain-containing protein CRADD-like n=1 Tax=Lineus longissimus TaxID=88925 RepID=UPI00315CDBCA